MDAGLVTSLSGALAQAKRVETISNNLANADTVAFKGDDLIFEEVLQSATQSSGVTDIPERPLKDSEILSRSGDEQRLVLYGTDFTNLKQGMIRQTNQPLDIAIEGNAFLEVLTPKGIRLTRAGNLSLDAGGRLVTRDGFLVLGAGAPTQDPGTRAIGLGTNGTGKIRIDSEGNIYGGPEQGNANLGKLSLVQVFNPKELSKDGSNLFAATPDAFVRPAGSADVPTPPRIHQGVLEASNVNPVQEMSKLIEAHRLFDQNTRLMQTMGDAAGRVSDVGKF